MRYWVRAGAQTLGPLDAEQVRDQYGAQPRTMVCPDKADHKDRRAWRPLANVTELTAAAAPKPVSATAAVAKPALISLSEARFFIRIGDQVIGPLPAEELLLMRGFGLARLVCPEGRDPLDRHHWIPVRTSAVLRAALAAPKRAVTPMGDRPEEPDYPALPVQATVAPLRMDAPTRVPFAAFIASLIWMLMAPASAPAPSARASAAPQPRSEENAAARAMIPSCLAGASAVVPNADSIPVPGGTVMLLPVDGKYLRTKPARFAYDYKTGALTPLDDEARRLADFRTGCK